MGNMENRLTPLTEFFQNSNSDITVEMFLDMLREVHCSQKEVIGVLNAQSTNLAAHIKEDSENFKKILAAFPDNDTVGHERYHRATIEWLELRNKTVRHALVMVAELGIVGAAGWIFYALWAAFLAGPPK